MSQYLGAIHGKHIAIEKQPIQVHFGIITKATFAWLIAINIGEYGSNNDCGVLLNSRMGREFQQNCINIPPPETLDGFDETVPFFLVATAVHNYLQQADNAHYTPLGFVDSEDKSGAIIEGQWRKLIDSNFQNVGPIRNSRYAKNALQIREV